MSEDGGSSSSWERFWKPAIIGGIGTAIVLGARHAARRESRAYREDPEHAEEVCELVGYLLEEWEPAPECHSEAEYTNDLYDWICEHSEFGVELTPGTRDGRPDMLIDGALALELKVRATKGELDRLVGQVAAYSREWVTWAIVIDTSESRFLRFVRLLEDKGLSSCDDATGIGSWLIPASEES